MDKAKNSIGIPKEELPQKQKTKIQFCEVPIGAFFRFTSNWRPCALLMKLNNVSYICYPGDFKLKRPGYGDVIKWYDTSGNSNIKDWWFAPYFPDEVKMKFPEVEKLTHKKPNYRKRSTISEH